MKFSKEISFIALLLIFTQIPLILISQQLVEVSGKLKVSQLDTLNNEELLVVRETDGTFAGRLASTINNSTIDTSRTIISDLLLTSTLCNCTNLPPAMIQSLLDNGYTLNDLVDFKIPLANLIDAGSTAEELLDEGLSPMEIFNAGMPADSIYGLSYGGGIIFYLDTLDLYLFEGLVCASLDQSSGSLWGCLGVLTGAEGTQIGDGKQNTLDFISECTNTSGAAYLCYNLVLNTYDDWFLPSKDELNAIWTNWTNNNLENDISDAYWSSTEVNSTTTWVQKFLDGYQNEVNKMNSHYVRAIREF